MFSLDDRAGNVLTTVALFVAAAAVLYVARAAVLVFLLSLFFAYLLEPAVTFAQDRSPLLKGSRNWAIAQVYLIATLVFGSLVYQFGPHLVTQTKKLNATVIELSEHLSTGDAKVDLPAPHGLTATQQLRLQTVLLRHRDFIVNAFGRAAESAAYIAEKIIWILPVPILAIFFLQEGRQRAGAFLDVVEGSGERTLVRRILLDVDTVLAKYVRAQLALAGLSFAFYSVSMSILQFPYAIVLGALGGVLEFLPVVGCVASAAMILTVGILTHSHWIWMAGLLGLWRLVQDYVNSPRIMGKTLQLRPLTVLFALMIGGQLGGIAGVFLAVPAVAVLRIVWLECSSARVNPGSRVDQPIVEIGDVKTNAE
jgi:predicted PurR-regulated permease PerM